MANVTVQNRLDHFKYSAHSMEHSLDRFEYIETMGITVSRSNLLNQSVTIQVNEIISL